jgi:hypothetical protein
MLLMRTLQLHEVCSDDGKAMTLWLLVFDDAIQSGLCKTILQHRGQPWALCCYTKAIQAYNVQQVRFDAPQQPGVTSEPSSCDLGDL